MSTADHTEPSVPSTVAHLCALIDAALDRLLHVTRRERTALATGHVLAARSFRVAVDDAAGELALAFRLAQAAMPFLPRRELADIARIDERRRLAATTLRIELSALAAARSRGTMRPSSGIGIAA